MYLCLFIDTVGMQIIDQICTTKRKSRRPLNRCNFSRIWIHVASKCMLDPDPLAYKILDPDPHKMYEELKRW